MPLPEGFQLENSQDAQRISVPEGFVLESSSPATSGMAPSESSDGWLTRAVKQVPAIAMGIARSGYDMGKEIVTHPVDTAVDVGRGMQGVIRRAPDTFKQVGAGVWQAMNEAPAYDPNATDAEGYNPTAGFYNREGVSLAKSNKAAAVQAGAVASQAQRNMEADKAADPRSTKTGAMIENTGESLLQQAPGAALAIAGLPSVGLPLMGLQTFGQKYAENRSSGMGIADATNNAAFQGGVEVGTELLPFVAMAKFMKPGKFSTKVVDYMLSEVPGEHIATALQNSSDAYFEEKDPAKRMAQVKEYLGSHKFTEDQVDTFWTTILQGGVMVGAGRAAKGVADSIRTEPPVDTTMQASPPAALSFQNESYDDTTDMPAPKGPLETATSQTIPTTTTGPDASTSLSNQAPDISASLNTSNIPAFTPPTTDPLSPEPGRDLSRAESREVTETDQVDFENAVLWENNLRTQGRTAVPDIEGESTRDHAWRLLETYRTMITPTVAADSTAAAVHSDSERPAAAKGGINYGATDILPNVPNQGAGQVDGAGVAVPALQTEVSGVGSDHRQPGGQVNGVSQVRQETGYAQEVPPVRSGDVTPIDEAAHVAATSPYNDIPHPTPAQIEAGNYKKGHVTLHGLDISIENPSGSLRKGVDESGTAWQTEMAHHYGYIKGTIGKDKDHIDVFLGPKPESDRVFVVDQIDPKTGTLDEHKVMLSFDSLSEARAGYLANYDKSGSRRIGAITETTADDFKQWLNVGDTKKTFVPVTQVTTVTSSDKAEKAATFAQTRLRALERKLKKAQGPVIIEKARKALNDHKATMKASGPEKVKVKTIRAAKPVEGLNPSRDHLLTAIAKLGGLDLANAESLWGNMASDAAADKKINHKLFGRPLFRKTGGLNVDTMAELLAEHGYLQRDENHKHDLVDFEERLTSAIAGKTVLSDQNHQEIALEMPDFSDEDLNELSLDDSVAEFITDEYADLFEELSEEDYNTIIAHHEAINREAVRLIKEIENADSESATTVRQDKQVSASEETTVAERDGPVVIEGDKPGETSETGKRPGAASPVESQDKLFATPPTFGTKPQPKTTNSDVSTSDLLDSFTSTESVQPDLLKEQTFNPVVMPSLDDFDKLVTELTVKPEEPPKTTPKTPAASGPSTTKAQSAKTHAGNAYDAGLDAIKATLDNASNPDKLNSGIGIDDEVYQQIKPHLSKMWFEAKSAGSDAMQALREFIQRVINDLGEKIVPYSRTFYQEVLNGDIIEVTNKGEETDVNVERSSADLERNSQDSGTADRVGQETLSDGSDGADGSIRSGSDTTTDSKFVTGRDPVLPRREAATPGEFGNPSVQSNQQQAESAERAAGSEFDQRSGDFDVTRTSSEPVAAAAVDKAATRVHELKARLEAQKSAQRVKVVPGDLGNIEQTLPLLLTGQTDDVKFAEDRFAQPTGYGAMFTNGTGTGKTFSGLGIIKRLERQGKKNVLIVTPQANVLNAWVKSGKHFLLDITSLKDTQDAGSGIVVTTYSNFGQNNALVQRQWDAVVFDEAHYLNSNQTGDATNAQTVMRAITLHPAGAWQRADMLNGELKAKTAEASAAFNEAYKKKAPQAELDRLKAPLDALNRKMDEARKQVQAEVTAAQGTDKRSRVLFLSATPFAYDKNIEYANGYLFDYGPPVNSGGYNSGGAKERFFMQHFGYRMRYNKLTEPEAEVDQGLMQRQFNSWLKQNKALSGRMLAVDQDYDRKFVLLDSAIGRTIDEGLQFLQDDHAQYGPLYSHISKKFDYLHRRYLLEAIKAKEIIPIIRQHLALNRKVVIFHDYNQGGGMNPFDVRAITSNKELVTVGTYPNQSSVELGSIAARFVSERPDLVKLPFASYGSALSTLHDAFPDALLVNGTVSKKDNLKAEELFQDHKSGRNLIIVQADKGKEGISLHDTVGDMPRVLFNLGLPVKPTQAIQQEGRIFRTGQASNAMFRYLNTGTNWERWAFATTIARRASTAENLAMGEDARMLLDAFVEAYQDSDVYAPGHVGEGTGGIARDRAANAALTEWDRALTYYFSQQKKTSRNKAQEGIDYFPTPEPLALKMVEWADILPGESALEPSAGHGAIARFLPANAKRRAIEPSTELTSRLGLIFDGDIVQGRFEDHHVVNKYDAIVMNPPFGSASKTAFEHIEKAAQHLKDKGRIVALIPGGPASDKRLEKLLYEEKVVPVEPVGQRFGKDVYTGDTVTINNPNGYGNLTGKITRGVPNGSQPTFWVDFGRGQTAIQAHHILELEPTGKREKKSMSDLTLVADIQLPRVTFERAGTSVVGHIIVLDKNRTDDGSSTRRRDYTAAETINDLFERVRDAELPERQRNSQPYEATPVTPTAVDTATGTVKADLAQNSGLLELSEFPHTQTGVTMYVAAMKDRLPAEQYAALNKLAKQNGGSYSKYKGGAAVPGFLFKNREARQAFVNTVAGGKNADEIKYSTAHATVMQGDSGLGDVTVAPAKSLPFIKRALEQENAEQVLVKGGNVDALKRVAAGFGKTIVFFKVRDADLAASGSENGPVRVHDGGIGDKAVTGESGESAAVQGKDTISGFVNPAQPNIIFLNVDSSSHLLYITGHELSHSIKMHDPALWDQMAKELKPLVSRWAEFKESLPSQYDKLSEDDKLQELFSDVMGNHFLNDMFWQDLAKENAGLFTKIARKAIQLISKALRLMVGYDVRTYISDLEQSRAIIAKTLLQYGENVNKEQYGKHAAQQDLEYLNSRLQGQSILEHLRSVGITDEKLRAALGIEPSKLAAAWHGSPHDHNGFSTAHIGTGEGAQVYGYGLYFAGDKAVAEHYRDVLSGDPMRIPFKKILAEIFPEREFSMSESADIFAAVLQKDVTGKILQNRNISLRGLDTKKLDEVIARAVASANGKLYHVELAPKEDEYLLWDMPLSEQSEVVKEAVQRAFDDIVNNETDYHKASRLSREYADYAQSNDVNGQQAYNLISKSIAANESEQNRQQAASEYLHSLGIRGIKYLDGNSRNRPLKDIKKAFLAELPDNSGFDDVMELVGTGRFSLEQESLLKALDVDDWLGFDYPAQAISAALGNNLNGFDPSQELRDAVADLSKDQQFNYVIFNDADVSITNKYSINRNLENVSEKSLLDNLKGILNPLDYSRLRVTASERLPHHATTWLADNVGNPFWMKENNPDAVPFYEEAKDREVTRMDNNVRMFGGLFDKEGKRVGWDKVKGLFDWSDKTTGWGKVRQEMYNNLTDKQKAAYDVIRFEGDAYNKTYAKLVDALRNVRIKAAGMDAQTFAFYQTALAEEAKAFDVKLAIAQENMAEAGMAPEDIEGHIAEYRAKYKDIEGWVHRDHGEGEYQVRVYQTVDNLDFESDVVQHKDEPTDRIRLGTFPGVELSRSMEKIVERRGGSFKQLRNGAIIILMPEGRGQEVMDEFHELPLVDKDGEPKYKVLVYNRFVSSIAEAKKLTAKVKSDYRAAMPRNYREGYSYDTSWNFSAKVNEEDYQVLKTSDMKLELILRNAIDKAKAKSEISAGDAAGVQDALVQSVAEILLGRGAGLYQIRRAQYLIEGYDTDNAVKKYEDYINGTAGLFSKARYALRQFNNMKSVSPQIRAWATKYVGDSLRNMGTADKISGNMRAIVSLWYLGFNTSWMLVNSTQPYVLGQAELSRYTTSPALKIAKAEKDILTGKLLAEEKALLEDMRVRSQDHDSVMAEMTGSLEGVTGKASQVLHNVTQAAMALGQKVEVLNRHTMIVAGYRVFKDQGMDHTAALKKALDVNSMVNIDMGRFNLPGWARGPIGRTFYALQSYIQHMLNYLWNRSSSGNRNDQKAVLRLLFAMFLIGGLPAGAPGSDELDKLIQKMFGYSPKLALKGWTRKMAKQYDTPGEMLEGFVWHGIPGALKPFGVGVSLTGATQLRMPIISNVIAGDDMAKSLGGPVWGLAQKGKMSIQAALRGDWGRSVEYLLPTAIANPLSGIRQATDGVKTASGKRVEYKGKQLKMEPQEAAIRAFGLQPVRTADISETRGYEKSTQAEWNDRRKDALDNYRMSRKLKFIQEFNKDLRGSQAKGLVSAISTESLANVWGKTNQKKNNWERANGVD